MNSNIYQEIKISDFPPTKIYVLLNRDIKKKLIETAKLRLNLKNNYYLSKWINKKSLDYGLNTKFNGGDIGRWINGSNVDNRTNINHPKYMPLWVVLELAKIADISIEELQSGVTSYRSGGSGSLILNPKLPIKITPELESIIFHLFGDGSAGSFTPSFFQKNKSANKQFLSKLKNCFGDFYENVPEEFCIRFPKAISDIISHYYRIDSFHSNKIRIPLKIYEANKVNKLACITAFILDEGNIRDVISIVSMNEKFLSDLKNLIESCGYKCKEIKLHSASNTFYLNLSNHSIEKFYQDYIKLINRFPTCSLANKHDKLAYIISRRKNKSKITEIDKAILELLDSNKLTTRQVSEKLGFANCTILHHLEKLYKDGTISRKSINIGFVWFKSS